MERWRMADPAKVYERIEAMRRRQVENSKAAREARAREGLQALFEGGMTEDQSQKLEQYLEIWFDYERSYRPHLGAPRVSVYSRCMQSHEGYAEPDDEREEAEYRYEKMIAETVSACMDELPWQQRAAITIRCEAKKTGASVIRNPRMTIEEHHTQYQAGKSAIFGMPRMQELMR